MHVGRNYTLFQTLNWTRRSILIFIFSSTIPVILYKPLGITWITIPWIPIALIGTAVAFYLGFKNNSSYERLWEARKIWGGIVNTSRTWGMMVKDFITSEYAPVKASKAELYAIHKRLIYRHIAWLNAMCCQLHTPRTWEHNNADSQYARKLLGYDIQVDPQEALKDLLPPEEIDYVLSKKNPAVHLIALQSKELKELKVQGYTEDFRHMELEGLLVEMYTLQGQSERIKNFPFPRQYATVNLFFIWIFIILVPFGMLSEFDKLGEHFVWLTVPFSMITSWVFHTMEMIGDYSENPFEGLWNDVPILAISRTIEIDLRDMLDETNLPPAIQPHKEYQILL